MSCIRRSGLRLALIVSMFLLVSVCIYGQTAFAGTILPAESDQPSAGCVLMGESGSFYTDAQKALDRINKIRYEACTTGVKDPRNTSRTLTEEDYVPLQWSQSLELIARLRAAETGPGVAMNGRMGHYRVNGKSVFAASYGGLTSSSENLAWNGGTGMLGGIEQWYEEKEYWENNTPGEITGHYTSLINPNFTYIGLGAFRADGAMNGCYNVVSSELSTKCGSLGQEMLGNQTNIIQTVEVKSDYINDYTFLGKGKLNTDQTCQYTPLAIGRLSSSASHKCYFWLVDDYTLSVSDSDIASLGDDNIVTAHKAGSFDLSVASGGNTLKTLPITVVCNHDKPLVVSIPAVPAKVAFPGMTAGEKCEVCGVFKVEPEHTDGLNPSRTSISSLSRASKAFTVKWKKSTSANATGYQIRYSLKSSMSGSKTVTVSSYKTYSKKISKLKANKKYYVQVRCYKKGKSKTGAGKTYYSSWSSKKSVKTR